MGRYLTTREILMWVEEDFLHPHLIPPDKLRKLPKNVVFDDAEIEFQWDENYQRFKFKEGSKWMVLEKLDPKAQLMPWVRLGFGD